MYLDSLFAVAMICGFYVVFSFSSSVFFEEIEKIYPIYLYVDDKEIWNHRSNIFLVWMEHNEHDNNVIMGTMASQITGITIVDSNIYSGKDQRKHQSSASLAFVMGIHR